MNLESFTTPDLRNLLAAQAYPEGGVADEIRDILARRGDR